MKIANLRGRLTLITKAGGVDVETASGGRFAADPQAVFDQWAAFRDWADGARAAAAVSRSPTADLGPPVPRPRAGVRHRPELPRPRGRIGAARCRRARRRSPSSPPASPVRPPTSSCRRAIVDWEVELVVVIGARARRVARRRAWQPRRRPDGRAGSLGARRAMGGRRAVLARQVVSGLRPDGPVAGDARRARQPGRPRARLQRRRRDGAEEPHLRHGLQRAAPHRRAVGDPAAAAG